MYIGVGNGCVKWENWCEIMVLVCEVLVIFCVGEILVLISLL